MLSGHNRLIMQSELVGPGAVGARTGKVCVCVCVWGGVRVK